MPWRGSAEACVSADFIGSDQGTFSVWVGTDTGADCSSYMKHDVKVSAAAALLLSGMA